MYFAIFSNGCPAVSLTLDQKSLPMILPRIPLKRMSEDQVTFVPSGTSSNNWTPLPRIGPSKNSISIFSCGWSVHLSVIVTSLPPSVPTPLIVIVFLSRLRMSTDLEPGHHLSIDSGSAATSQTLPLGALITLENSTFGNSLSHPHVSSLASTKGNPSEDTSRMIHVCYSFKTCGTSFSARVRGSIKAFDAFMPYSIRVCVDLKFFSKTGKPLSARGNRRL